MVRAAKPSVEAYVAGVQRIGGPPKYYECGKKADIGPAIEVAKCLEAARIAKTMADWADAYARKVFGKTLAELGITIPAPPAVPP